MRKEQEMTREEALRVLLETISELFETLNSNDVCDAIVELEGA